jgi:hypothetical protein
MDFAFARGLVSHLIAFAVILQGIEMLQMLKAGSVLKIWGRENLETEMKIGLPLPLSWIETLAKDDTLQILAWAEIGIGAIAFIHPSATAFLILFFTHLMICVRFRGSVNGGSDSMTAMILLGCIFAFLFKKESFARVGLVWIAINLLLSYGRAGISKIRQPEWKDGTALAQFFEQSFFADIRKFSKVIAAKPDMAKYVCWALIAIEVGLVASPFAASALPALLIFVVLFHFSIYWVFGLNRFFWVWLAAWPSIFYLSGLVK